MNETALRQPRRVLPRWRLFKATSQNGELQASNGVRKLSEFSDGGETILRWKQERTHGLAAEILSLALIKGDVALAEDSARFIEGLRIPGIDATPLESLALATLRSGGKPLNDPWLANKLQPSNRTISGLRKIVRLQPRNPVAWTELALLHASAGNKLSARRCMLVAVTLAPEDRYVLRSAVRCFAHLRDHEIGMKILSRASRTAKDPWVMSAHIALTQALEKPQRLMKNAKAMLEAGSFSPWDLSELNAAVGSVLNQEGSLKKANKHFRASLLEPTENALCQVVVDRQAPDWREIVNAAPHPEHSFESDARTSYFSLDLKGSCKSAAKWLEDEPFSARPALFGSFVAGVALEDYDQGLKFVEEGLKPNPHSSTLLNNKAVLLARHGDCEQAEDTLRLARFFHDGEGSTATVLDATEGLVLFRRGEVERGRELYRKAIKDAESNERPAQAALARVFLAREEFDAGTTLFDSAMEDARRAILRLPSTEIDSRITFLKLKEKVDQAREMSNNGIQNVDQFELQFRPTTLPLENVRGH